MPAYPPPPLDVALERRLLRVVEHVAGGAEEDHHVVLREVRVGERRGVLRRVDVEAVARRHLRDRHVPDGMHSVCRNAAVLEKTSALNRFP